MNVTIERTIQDSPVPELDKKRINSIRKAIMAESKSIRNMHPVMNKYQSWLGLTILSVSVIAMALTGYAYVQGTISAWIAIPLIAFICSIAHEIEHDTIHKAYFPKSKAMQNLFFTVVWLMRPGTISPWIRKDLHLAHHKISGTRRDIEERSITNGEPWGVKRLIMISDGFLAVLLRLNWQKPERIPAVLKASASAYFPLGFLHHAIWWSFLTYHIVVIVGWLMGVEINFTAPIMLDLVTVMNSVVVIWIAPHFLRSFCINFVSSNMHYFGDIEAGNVVKQTQIIDSWLFMPFHLFCFNFGKTHGLHHFWAADPFYLRQLTAKKVIPVMVENGVRLNDFANMSRANRFALQDTPTATL